MCMVSLTVLLGRNDIAWNEKNFFMMFNDLKTYAKIVFNGGGCCLDMRL